MRPFGNIWKLDVAELTAVDWRRSKLVIMTERHEESLQSVPFRADRLAGLDESSPIPTHRLSEQKSNVQTP